MKGSWGERRTTPTAPSCRGGRPGYRIWYDIWDGDCHNFYATSRDGVHWIRPRLGLVDHRGSRANNLFYRRTRLDHMPQIIHTPWEADSDRRYKMVNFDFGAGSRGPAGRGYWGATSPDGIHWTDSRVIRSCPIREMWVTSSGIPTGRAISAIRSYSRRCGIPAPLGGHQLHDPVSALAPGGADPGFRTSSMTAG